ncbi:MAG: phage portal protein, partial [Pseudophaeobacter sp.]
MRFDLPWRKKQSSEPLASPAMVTQTKASAAARGIAWQGSGAFSLAARDTSSLTRLGYLGNPVGFRAVRMVIEAAAALPLVVQDAAQRY